MKTSRLALLFCAVCPAAHPCLALDPPPGGGYPYNVTALGTDALFNLNVMAESDDTAIGFEALYHATAGGGGNTAVGSEAMLNTTGGGFNTAVGSFALVSNTTGNENVAMGNIALASNTTGQSNVAIGDSALTAQTNGYANVAIGEAPMWNASPGNYNVAIGHSVMGYSTGIGDNVAIGDGAMNMSSGNEDIAIGQEAGIVFAGSDNIAIGRYAAVNATTGGNNIFIGQEAAQNVTTGSNNIEIGSEGAKKDDAVIRIGDPATQQATYIAGIRGTAISNGVAVVINKQGQLGVAKSAAGPDEIAQLKAALGEMQAALQKQAGQIEALRADLAAQRRATSPPATGD